MTSNADYMREYRRNNPDYYQRERKREAARKRAWRQLAEAHREEFALYYEAECKKVRIAPYGTPGRKPKRQA
jgi:hypothetical protein